MKVSIGIGGAASGQRPDFHEQVEYVVEAEKLGIDAVWTAEALVRTRLRRSPISPREQAVSGLAPASCRSARGCPR
jgi:alkanesulfonate monooxygenase SsuD/methylene tetrahydromethanopterin reductase-like flavin-dependent oxidoreductase (luciferase family)